MLIDSSHPEETRVVVLDGQKVEEFDFEAASKRPLKGNIYLAKVTRVEPSLQAAFVEYGGNRQGFLAFAEIHPDYYQIPIADRLALLAEQEAEARRHAEDDVESIETASIPAQESAAAAAASSQESDAENHGSFDDELSADSAEEDGSGAEPSSDIVDNATRDSGEADGPDHADTNGTSGDSRHVAAEAATAEDGSHRDTAASHAKAQQASRPPQRWTRKRHYKIQEVIKRRQVILVQVVKEERGNKGAALTTYLSLAGRYCVLMPNTPRGGGISRKITSATDRTRLKSAAQSLELPEGMGLIIRTAGENRTKAEIKRDYEYLLRMWDTIRELTLKSNAPACVYEEGDLIKRAIRDLYNKDVSEILVEGDSGYRNAKDFMRMLMPSHAKNVKQYREVVPLFQRHQIEAQLDAMFTPTVTLRSGGYIVINQTEALVSIDVNSGRATREHSIEDTAYKTNLEAAEEIARQLRLRDLAGLIVIDFIDMEDMRNDRNVEKRLRDCVKNDRARVQIGKISQFGLLEMSRQRLRAGVVAGSTVPCPHCAGQGIVRSVESTALRLLRALEEEAQRRRAAVLAAHASTEVTIYTLNQKRKEIARIEAEYDVTVQFDPKDDAVAGSFEIERSGQRAPEEQARIEAAVQPALPSPAAAVSLDEEDGEEPAHDESASGTAEAKPGDAQPSSSSRRRRRRRGGRDRAPASGQPEQQPRPTPAAAAPEKTESAPGASPTAASPQGAETAADGTRKRKRRRRGRRGSRDGATGGQSAAEKTSDSENAASQPPPELGHADELPAPIAVPNAPSEPLWSLAAQDVPHQQALAAPEPRSNPRKPVTKEPVREPEPIEAAAEAEEVPAGPPRRGWWQRPFRAKE
jgi:ribonuclease E